ncbi:HotDog domain-containing protein [Schizophyllum amplum]|uniref:HotDog domain-containing protein n=1 Tax=Schizophyllum amplum TaxID=97359 RepID=A0A550CWQ5_9AGAR|nr:HotDog domain-containing protein [Auriculariopsis ampla]
MSARSDSVTASAAVSIPSSSTSSHYSRSAKSTSSRRAWVEPAALPNYGDISLITGNAPDYVKQLTCNTFYGYGVGEGDAFGSAVGHAVRFKEISIDRKLEKQGRFEATTVADLLVTKHMLNGAGMLHGGCIAYLIDNTPLVVLGLVSNVNGVGVTQGMNIMFHAPAPLGTRLRIVSTSVSLGGRVMTARCEIIDRDSGRSVASAFINKMQPVASRL